MQNTRAAGITQSGNSHKNSANVSCESFLKRFLGLVYLILGPVCSGFQTKLLANKRETHVAISLSVTKMHSPRITNLGLLTNQQTYIS